MTRDYAIAVHDDRRARLLADADHRRLRRVADDGARPIRPAWSRRLRLSLAAAISRRHDPKAQRIATSWLGLGHRDAAVLAGIADEVHAAAGTMLAPGRYAYIALDDRHAGLVVAVGTPAVTLSSAARLLTLPDGHFRATAAVIPQLAQAWTLSTWTASTVSDDAFPPRDPIDAVGLSSS